MLHLPWRAARVGLNAQRIENQNILCGTFLPDQRIYRVKWPAGAEALFKKKLLAALPGIRLTIAGCGCSEEYVRRFFSGSAQASLDIRAVVPRAEMPALYADHDIFVLPSLVEGMPLVLLEAMASGLPVVTTESSGMADLVENGHDGLLTIPGDSAALFAATKKLCEDSQLRSRLGGAAQVKMRRFSWTQCAAGHEAVFRRALGLGQNLPGDFAESQPRSPQPAERAASN